MILGFYSQNRNDENKSDDKILQQLERSHHFYVIILQQIHVLFTTSIYHVY